MSCRRVARPIRRSRLALISRRVAFAGLLAGLATTSTAWTAPTNNAFSQVPARFNTRELTVGSRALGETCLSRAVFPDLTVCNPAFLGEVEESRLLGRVFIGNGYAAISTANQFIFKPISKEFLQELFQKGNITGLEAHAGLVFTTRHFSTGFSPYRIQYLSEVHNPNFPVVAVHASVERAFQVATGYSLAEAGEGWEPFSVGVRLRILERQFVHGSFTLFDAITQDPRALLPVQTQRVIFLDPVVGWVRNVSEWKLRASFGARNLGLHRPDTALYPEPFDLESGVGVEPPLGFGSLKLGVDFTDLIHGTDLASRPKLGASYRLGILEAMAGWNAEAVTFGLQFGIEIVQVGIVYELMRKDLEGAHAQDRIATEVSISL